VKTQTRENIHPRQRGGEKKKKTEEKKNSHIIVEASVFKTVRDKTFNNLPHNTQPYLSNKKNTLSV
jgi:hypothetical protein